jgi:hypothetical protein
MAWPTMTCTILMQSNRNLSTLSPMPQQYGVWYYFDSDIEQSVDSPIWYDAAESFVTPQCLSLIEMAFYWLVNTILRGVHALLLMDHWWVPVAVVSVCGIFASLPTQAQSSILGIGAFFVCNSIIESDFDWIHSFRD